MEPAKNWTKEEMEIRDDNKNFYDQFDPKSNLHHGGITTPVPIGGQNVPESMPTEFPEGFDPNAPIPVDHSAEDPQCIEIKEAIQLLKAF